jgi:Protein of unknown function (DUF3631)
MHTENEKDHTTQDRDAASGPEVEDLAAILDGMVDEIRRHVVLGPHYAEAVALWLFHAHGIAACQYSPRLNLRSPEAECGKTTLLEIIQAFCEVRGSQIESSTTPAAYFRYVHQASTEGELPPIMLLDEIDNFLDVNRTDAYSILNSGHKLAGAWVNRCDITSEGVYKANRYCTWAPCVLAGIGEFNGNSKQIDTLKSRCIVINLKRKMPSEEVAHFDDEAKERCVELGRQAAAWCAKHAAGLRTARPDMPEWLYNREADSWRMLFKFADAAGGRWPEAARAAAKALNGRAENPSEGVMLLRDLRNAFDQGGVKKSTAELLNYLHGLPERPWGRKAPGDLEPTFQDRQLSAALRPFDIKAKSIRLPGQVLRGFTRDQFEDAWARYLPREEPEDVADKEAA